MSGGHYDYGYVKVQMLADEIEREFIKDGKYERYDEESGDYLTEATPEERPKILDEVNQLVKDLNSCAQRAKELEWFLSADTGPDDFLERVQKIKKDI